MERICIYTKDISNITGKGERTAQKIMKEVRAYYNKQKHQFLSKNQLAFYLGIPPEEIVLDKANNIFRRME